MLRANGQGRSSATVLAAHFAKQNTKFGSGGKARTGKNSFPPTLFLFARPSANLFQNSASGFSLKKVRISFRVRSQIAKSSRNRIVLKNRLLGDFFDAIRSLEFFAALLPLQNAFRTLDWKRIKEEIEPFVAMMKQTQRLLPVNA